MDEESKKFQRKLAGEQVILGGIIAIGCTVFAIGAALWILSMTVLDKIFSKGTMIVTLTSNNTTINMFTNNTNFEQISNSSSILNLTILNSWTELFVYSGLFLILVGFGLGFLLQFPKTKKEQKEGYCTACPSSNPNPLPCDIHENKSSPI